MTTIAVRRVTGLAGACHPGPTVVVTGLVTALAAIAGRDPAGCALAGAAVLAGQLSIGWGNDAVDAGRDAAAGRTDKPAARGSVDDGVVRAAAVAALLCCVPLSLASGAAAGVAHLLGVGAGWAYNLGLKATALSFLPYAAGFAALPAFVALGLPGAPWPAWWAVLAAALLGVGAHLANVLPDIDGDLAAGVRGGPQRLGRARTRVLLPMPLLAATALLALAPPGGPGPAGWAALPIAVAATAAGLTAARRRPRAPFWAAVAVAAVDVALLLATGGDITR
ncbi:hypothetical protein DP939_17475 [Spongiactinospora rosea]|uniref:4-hydroxybenzoate polyprenyltransferase n=1 Tax=Spongiactinospora rosea TaxID=2248750 RepID=A0A366LYD4_9ACTN|nr:UbiA family prenyltransferase [Spongiactinospora rosea]RBQ18976.1 hypothetical protein DP939_17475 [Spongiactinospora rosea]